MALASHAVSSLMRPARLLLHESAYFLSLGSSCAAAQKSCTCLARSLPSPLALSASSFACCFVFPVGSCAGNATPESRRQKMQMDCRRFISPLRLSHRSHGRSEEH